MLPKAELQKLIEVLSDYECRHLLSVVDAVGHGERFWEGDVGLFYNEYIKLRTSNVNTSPASAIPTGPTEQGGFFASIPLHKTYAGEHRIPLPAPEPLPMPLSDVLQRRRSRRNYSGQPIALATLSSLLHHACGITGYIPAYDFERMPLRAFPSSGGLQSPELYLFVTAVDGLAPGIYHYAYFDHTLELIESGDQMPALKQLTLEQPYIETSSVVFAITGYFERLRWKYGERSYRYMCIDAGFLGENLYLAAEALNLGLCALAGFFQDRLEDLLHVNGRDEIALLLMTLGAPAE